MAKSKESLKNRLLDFDQDMLYTIINELLKKHPNLQTEVELIIDPTSINNPSAYYKKIITKEIGTHNYTCFPNKGVDGLQKCFLDFKNFKSLRLYGEAWKMASAILFVIFRCEYTTKNILELEVLEMDILDELAGNEFYDFGLDKIKSAWFRTILLNRYKTKARANKFISKFQNDHDQELIVEVMDNLIKKPRKTKIA